MISALINKSLWDQYISKNDWYLYLQEEFTHLRDSIKCLTNQDYEHRDDLIYAYIEEALDKGMIPIAASGPDWDKDRKKISHVVIHHSSRVEDISLPKLNAMHLMHLYVPYFISPSLSEMFIKGSAIWSGHFVGTTQVFYGYHWLVRKDGECIRLLDDSNVGWHSGNLSINNQSVGICLDDDLENKEPSEEMLESVAAIIRDNYPHVEILGHHEVHKGILCPGMSFDEGWKKELQRRLRN